MRGGVGAREVGDERDVLGFRRAGLEGTACAVGAAMAATANARVIRLNILCLIRLLISFSSLVGRLRCLPDGGEAVFFPA